MSNSNPEKAIQAIADPAPLTLAQIALFEKIDAPILHADISCLRDNLIAVWIYKTPLHEVARNFERREELALLMSEGMTGEEYGNVLTELIRACTAFYEMMPRRETGEDEGDAEKIQGEEESGGDPSKKASSGSATAGSRSSQNGYVGPTTTRRRSYFARALRSIWRCCTGAGRKASDG